MAALTYEEAFYTLPTDIKYKITFRTNPNCWTVCGKDNFMHYFHTLKEVLEWIENHN